MAYTSPSLAAVLAQTSSCNALLLLSFVASLLALSYFVTVRFKSRLLRARPQPPPIPPPPPHAPPLSQVCASVSLFGLGGAGGLDAEGRASVFVDQGGEILFPDLPDVDPS